METYSPNADGAPSCGDSGQVVVIAHRGGEAYAPENTLAAFAHTARLGVEWVETDLRLCRSGEVVLFHDETVERTTNGTGAVSELTLSRPQELDAGSWFAASFSDQTIPTLSALLDSFGRDLRFMLEIKDRAVVSALVQIVRPMGPTAFSSAVSTPMP